MAVGNQTISRQSTSKRQDTKERLKSAARVLFAQYGIEAVTVRDILAAAGERNGASLNYHFGKKEELVRQIAEDIFGLMEKVWAEGLARLDARAEPATIRELITLMISSGALRESGGERTARRLIDRLSRERQHMLSVISAENDYNGYRMIIDRIAALQPHIPRTVMAHRAIFLTRYISVALAAYEETRNADPASGAMPGGSVYDLGNVIDTAVGIMCAPIVDGG